MGGNALKSVTTIRKKKVEYDQIKNIIISKIVNYLTSNISNIKYGLIMETPNKEDFGDLDILISGNDNEIFDMINFFEPDEIQRSGNVFSFNYKDFQIDFLQVSPLKPTSISMAQFFYNYGDIGMILGKIFSTYGFKFGQKGLSLHLKDYCDSILFLSDNPSEICEYFDYNYQRWTQGFSKIEECFDWIISSKYFRKNIFVNGNFKVNKKLCQRPFYLAFLDYIKFLPNFYYKKYLDFLPSINFFNKESEYLKIKEDIEIKNIIYSKFNENIFIDLGYTLEKNNLPLGKFIDKFKSSYENFNDFIINTNQEKINELIKNFINETF